MTLPPSLRTVFAAAAFSLAAGAAALADPAHVTLVVGGKPVPFIVTPYLGANNDVYAPVEAVRLMNADFTPNPADGTVTVRGDAGDAGAAGKSVTVPYQDVQGRYCIPIQQVADALGASTDWQPDTDTLTIRARLLMVRDEGNSLAIFTSYPVYYHAERMPSQNKVYIDLYGVDLSAQPANIPFSGSNVLRIRSGQMGENVVRIVADLKKNAPLQVLSPLTTDQVLLAMEPGSRRGGSAAPTTHTFRGATAPAVPDAPDSDTASVDDGGLAAPLPSPQAAGGVQITDVSLVTSNGTPQILITASGAAKYSTELLDNPYRLAFDLSGATLGSDLPAVPTDGSPIMKAVRTGIFRSGVREFGRVVVDLQKLVPFKVTSQPGPNGETVYAINFQTPGPDTLVPAALPAFVAGSLSGKIIVVDPGHGEQDSGAVGLGGVMEKNLTLAIGLKLRDTLEQDGATVYMTRDSDTFLPVMARPAFAIAHKADLFVSVHCDESGPPNSHAGTTVYYHADNPICRRMAADISSDIGQLCRLPVNGTKSDTIRFGSGFGVLRGSPMPAVLVECGYVNDASDLTILTDPDAQQQIATGIANGMRDFLAGRTAHR